MDCVKFNEYEANNTKMKVPISATNRWWTNTMMMMMMMMMMMTKLMIVISTIAPTYLPLYEQLTTQVGSLRQLKMFSPEGLAVQSYDLWYFKTTHTKLSCANSARFLSQGIHNVKLLWIKGVCVRRCNLPPALLAEWPEFFTCHCGNTGCNRHRIRVGTEN